MRANERAAAASGINVPRTKLIGAAMGSFLASTAGVLMAYKFVDFSNAGFEASHGLAVVALAYIGGIATVSGAFVAGILAPAGILFTPAGRQLLDRPDAVLRRRPHPRGHQVPGRHRQRPRSGAALVGQGHDEGGRHRCHASKPRTSSRSGCSPEPAGEG